MSEVLAIVGAPADDEDLLAQIARRTPARVTVLVEQQPAGQRPPGGERERMGWPWDDSERGQALRERLARLLSEIELRTGAAVVGLVGDPDQLVGWRFDRVVRARVPIAA